MPSHGHAKHGARSRTYRSWEGMRSRCNNPTNARYQQYGGRGITVDPLWESFEHFLADMGECPLDYTIERVDNSKGYSKSNCKWASYTEQNKNRRTPKNNTSGVKGVSFIKSKGVWQTIVKVQGRAKNLYTGADFFEAVCVRKRFENRSGYTQGA